MGWGRRGEQQWVIEQRLGSSDIISCDMVVLRGRVGELGQPHPEVVMVVALLAKVLCTEKERIGNRKGLPTLANIRLSRSVVKCTRPLLRSSE